MEVARSRWHRLVLTWLDSGTGVDDSGDLRAIDWPRLIPFIGIHVACLGVFFVGWSPIAVAVATGLYVVRMLAITGFYHRYFSHKAFRTSRAMQLVFAIAGASAVQRGPLWWAAHHRHHHGHADRADDAHSPRDGFFWSHMGWFMSRKNFATRMRLVPDLARFPELRFLDRYDALVPALLVVVLWAAGAIIGYFVPATGVTGPQLVIWGFAISTVALYHATFTINSLAHRIGRRRYATRDDSRNSVGLALLTFGEGWHNNHHHYPGSARQGFFWWELDVTYWFLRALAATGLIWDLRAVPARVRDARRIGSSANGTGDAR